MSLNGWGGYPWDILGNTSEYAVITVTSVPGNVGTIPRGQGSDTYVPAPAHVAFQLQRGNAIVQTPWMPVTVSPMVLPVPSIDPSIIVTILESTLPGATINVVIANI